MSTNKRKAKSSDLQRRVKSRQKTSEGPRDAPSPATLDLEYHSPDHVTDSPHVSHERGSNSEYTGIEVSDVSFGALVKVETLFGDVGRKASRSARGTEKGGSGGIEVDETKSNRLGYRDFNRTSKHAPRVLSSKKAVSRKREVVRAANPEHRDPRFEPSQEPMDKAKFKAAYAFLDDYRDSEMKELKGVIKNTKDIESKETLKRALMSMESRRKAELRRSKEQEILSQHKKEEKDLIRQGKQPFYLKRTEQRKRVLLEQYRDLKGKQLDHVIERRRKKLEGKEKKNLPFARRGNE